MELYAEPLPGLLILCAKKHSDDRGYFTEIWRNSWEKSFGIIAPFIQENFAFSNTKGVLRGLHFQTPPYAQSKLVWVSRGSIYDVAVDLRIDSPTYLQWHAVTLSAGNGLLFYVPQGFAHGYLALEDKVAVHYKVDAYYAAGHEYGIAWNDPKLAIPWPCDQPVLSIKDRLLPAVGEYTTPFTMPHANE